MTEAKDKPFDPFEAVTQVGCRLEQADAALKVFSDNFHELWDGHHALGTLPEPLSAYLYEQWLLLEVIRRDHKAINELLARADNALCHEGYPRQFSAKIGAAS